MNQKFSVDEETRQAVSYVNYRGQKLGDQGVTQQIENQLPSTLTALNLTDNDIGDLGAVSVAGLLESSQTLGTLNLTSNKIGLNGITAIYNALRKNKSTVLHTLYLCENYLGPDAGVPIAKIIEEVPKLTHLNLYNNKLADRGAKKIAAALSQNSTLSYIGLSGNRLTDLGAKYIADALKINRSVEKLYLHNNNFTDEGARAIYNMLIHLMGSFEDPNKKSNSRFKVINLTGNRISPQMVSGIKNEFFTRIQLLDIEQQKTVEIEPLKLDYIIEKKDSKTIGSKSPRSKKKKKSREEQTSPPNPTQPEEQEDQQSLPKKKKNETDDLGRILSTVHKPKGTKGKTKKTKTENEDPGAISNEDEKDSGVRDGVSKGKLGQVLTPIGDSNIMTLMDQQIHQNLLKAEYTVVVLKEKLQKKKTQLANAKKLLQFQGQKPLGEGSNHTEIALQLEYTKKKLAHTERQHLETELELEHTRKELEDLHNAFLMAKGLIVSLENELAEAQKK